ncbi:MAG: hypothetical protein WBB69_05985 [Anaerolineales bacterium]
MIKKQHRVLIWTGGILLIVALLVGAMVWGISQVPVLADQFPQNDAPVTITILSPDSGSSWPADASIPIQAIVQSDNPITEIELWIDGQRISSIQPENQGSPFINHIFHWLPITTGDSRIFVRALSSAGNAADSNILKLNIIEASGFKITSESLPDDATAEVIYPLLPDPINDQINLPGPPPAEEGDTFTPIPVGSDFSLWLGQIFTSTTNPPASPSLSYALDDCSINLIIKDQADSELGFFVYRSTSGVTSFERIATLGKVDIGTTFIYKDQDQVDQVIYYVSAFNGSGEASSNPVQIQFPVGSCPSPGVDNNQLPDLNQALLDLLDLAYFYYAFNGGGYQRYPHNSEVFLTPSEYPTPLVKLVEGLTSSSQFPVSTADVIVWGWDGGTLVNLGAYHLDIDDSRLTVCNLGIGCQGDVASGFRSTYGELASDEEGQLREFYWSTNSPGTTGILWQISTTPFSQDHSPHPYGLVGAGCADGSLKGSFQVDFTTLDNYLPAPSGCGDFSMPWLETSQFSWENILNLSSEIRYYIRFTPMAGNQPSGKPSNTVEILAKPGETEIEPVIVDHLPDIYDVEILSFTPLRGMDPKYWGCVHILSLDYDTIWAYYRNSFPQSLYSDASVTALVTEIYNQINYALQNNLILCPSPYNEPDSSILSEWGSMFMEGLGELWDSVVSTFNALKAEIVDFTALALKKLGIPCDSDCKARLMTGLEIGIAYFTGIPPNLPDFENLKDQGIEYAIELAAAEAGIPCPEECQEVLREGLEDVVDLVSKRNNQPGCVDANWAHLLGKNPLCLPPGVVTKAVLKGVSKPASAKIQITRTGQAPPGRYKYHDQLAYQVNVSITSENSLLSGNTIPYTYSFLDWDAGYQKSFEVLAPITKLQNDVFDSQTIPIPPLNIGDSLTIPLSLQPHSYYIPEHLHSLMIELNAHNLEIGDVWGIGGNRGSLFDWLCLYNGGLIKIEAQVMCLSTPSGLIGNTEPDENSALVPCGEPAAPLIYLETSNPCYP